MVQRTVDALDADGTPTKANKVLRYLRRVYRWGVNNGQSPTIRRRSVEGVAEQPSNAR